MQKKLRAVLSLADISNKAVGERLRQAREALGFNQRQFALRAGLTANSYNQYEKAINRPNLEAAIKLCEAHRLTLDYIYRGELSNIPGEIWEHVRKVRTR